jgi:hypothetical protein
LQDYQQGRKTAPPPGTNAFGVGSSTGGLFGQPTQQQNGTGLFGQQPAQPAATGFGASGSTGLFGQQQPATGTTAFGQPAQQSTGFGAASTGTGLFGSNTQSTGLFGQTPQAQQTGGLFGQQPQQQGQTGLFGQQPAAGATGGLFGSNTASTTTGGGLFGQNNTTQPAASTGFSFGAANNNSTQAKPAFGTGFGAARKWLFLKPMAIACNSPMMISYHYLWTTCSWCDIDWIRIRKHTTTGTAGSTAFNRIWIRCTTRIYDPNRWLVWK